MSILSAKKNSIKNSYAMAIPLTGSLLDLILETWAYLEAEFGIKYIYRRSGIPHITLIAGRCRLDHSDFIKTCKKITASVKPFVLMSKGIGLFALDSPLIYVRWNRSVEIVELYNDLGNQKQLFYDSIETSCLPDNWCPKTTLAYRDTEYKGLSDILKNLTKRPLSQTIHVDRFAIIQYGIEGESLVDTIHLKHLE